MEQHASLLATDDRPFEGRTLVVTRPEAQADALALPLEEGGARVVVFPTIRIVPPRDPEPLRRAAREAPSYDWLVFTSVNGVEAFAGALDGEGIDPGELVRTAGADAGAPAGKPPRVCAIGPATGEALARAGLPPALIPREFVAEAVVEALAANADLQGSRILLPRAAAARAALPDGLRARGARVDVVEAYRTVPARTGAGELRRLLDAGEIDLVTFTASSTVRNFHRAVGGEPGGAKAAAIGPVTAATARELGYQVVAVAEEYTIPGLIEACARYFADEGAR